VPQDVIYLMAHSTGAEPTDLVPAMEDFLNRQWADGLVGAWNNNDWITLPPRLGDRLGRLVGAAPGQVMCGDSTSVQLFQALFALCRLNPERHTLITDANGFPADVYAAETVAKLLGMKFIQVPVQDLPGVLDDDTAVVGLGSVDVRTGEVYDVRGLTEQIHRAGGLVMWDLAHGIGVLPYDLDGLGVDAAVGSTYKYLSGGPGSPAFIYIPHRHQARAEMPLAGWLGHAAPFGFEPSYRAAGSIERARIGSPSAVALIALEAALDIFDEVSIEDIRAKSLQLTALTLDYLDAYLPEIPVATPREEARRGDKIALKLPYASELSHAMAARGVACDFRGPDILRLGFAPLYVSFTQVWDALEALRDIVQTRAYEDPAYNLVRIIP
jgi:kynureninase